MMLSTSILHSHNVQNERTFGHYPSFQNVYKSKDMEQQEILRHRQPLQEWSLLSKLRDRPKIAGAYSSSAVTAMNIGTPRLGLYKRDTPTRQTQVNKSSTFPNIGSLDYQPSRGIPTPTLSYIPDREKYKIDRRPVHFRNSQEKRLRHFFVHPDWMSEGLIRKRIQNDRTCNPMSYGWI